MLQVKKLFRTIIIIIISLLITRLTWSSQFSIAWKQQPKETWKSRPDLSDTDADCALSVELCGPVAASHQLSSWTLIQSWSRKLSHINYVHYQLLQWVIMNSLKIMGSCNLWGATIDVSVAISVDISTDTRPSIGRVSTAIWSILGWVSVNISVEYQPIYRLTLLSVDVVGVHRYFTNTSPMLHWYFTAYIGRYIGVKSVDGPTWLLRFADGLCYAFIALL